MCDSFNELLGHCPFKAALTQEINIEILWPLTLKAELPSVVWT